ncbi:SRPBCC family protein [Candidatus Poriferisodalis sp.]|uniref:SRPBCC family protein n=1 Tax=Candidatus Poriferisodalis sp. TaxID=3101277 RepID=UPI003B5C6907
MAQAFSVDEVFHRPAAQVWEALTDWPNAHQWMPGVEGMTAEGDTAEGTQLKFRARGADRLSTIAQCDAGRSIVLRSVQGGVTADYAYEVHEHGEDSARVTLVANCQITGLLWRLLSPLLRVAVRMSDGKQLRLLKAIVEVG